MYLQDMMRYESPEVVWRSIRAVNVLEVVAAFHRGPDAPREVDPKATEA